MKSLLHWSLCALALAAMPLHAEPKKKATTEKPAATPIEPPAAPVEAPARWITDFRGDEIGLVFRTLARQAGKSVVVEEGVVGTVTLRIENKMPWEILQEVCRMHDLKIEEINGVNHIKPKNPLSPEKLAEKQRESKMDTSIKDALLKTFTPAILELNDSVLDYEARPETAKKMARAKKALFDALVAEGFTRDEALRIVIAEPRTVPDFSK